MKPEPLSFRCKIRFCVGLVVASAIHCISWQAFAAPQESPRKIALLVGVSDYQAIEIQDLKFAENDTRVVGSQLERMGFEVTALAGKEATRQKTIAAIESFMEKASQLETNDIVFVMFSGHGQQIRARQETQDGSKLIEVPYFCPADSIHHDQTKVTTRGKSESEIGEELNFVSLNRVLRGMDESSNSLNNLLVVDACRNNPSKGKSTGISGTSATVPRGVNILFAAGSGQKSWESADEKIEHGVFTHFLIRGLSGKAKNSRGQVTWSRLASYLQEEVAFAGPALAGGKDRVQNPHSIINSSNLIVLNSPNANKSVSGANKAVSAGNWTRFRGENGQGKLADCNFPLQWSETENLRWKVELPGPGASSPIIFDGKVFVTAHSGYGKYANENANVTDLKKHLIAYDLKTGKQDWMVTVDGSDDEKEFAGLGMTNHGYSSHTPVTDGERVYAYFGRSGVHAFSLDGQKKWSRQFGNTTKPRFGSAGSPIIFEDLLIVNASCENGQIYALNSETGTLAWSFVEENTGETSSTPILIRSENQTQIVTHLIGMCIGLDARKGNKLWEFDGGPGSYHQAGSPIVAGSQLVFSQSYKGVFAIDQQAASISVVENKSWSRPAKNFSTPIEFGDELLVFDGRGIMSVIDKKSGDQLDKHRITGLSKKSSASINSLSSYASPILAGENAIVVMGMGDTLVIGKDEDTYETRFINRLGDDDEAFLATPAATRDELIIRSDKYLYCVSQF